MVLPLRWLVLALLAGKVLDAVSTVVVLSLVERAYETQWLARRLMAAFGRVGGMVVGTAIVFVLVVSLAEGSRALVLRLPDDRYPPWCAEAVRAGTYLGSGAWYGLVGIHNFMLLA